MVGGCNGLAAPRIAEAGRYFPIVIQSLSPLPAGPLILKNSFSIRCITLPRQNVNDG